ncbi:MAG: hydrogenase expression/formation protein [Betaproteobacteria bacterium]|nr:hydrogenase expression/formation protein [Betaproteobacteria bacterium]
MHAFPIPVVAMTLGPGSQQEEESLDYLPMPHEMRTYRAPVLPEPEEMAAGPQARAFLAGLLNSARAWKAGMAPISLELGSLPPGDRQLIDQVLGEGEVSAQVTESGGVLAIQESVFAGVWRLRGRSADGGVFAERLEVGAAPAALLQARLMGSPAPETPSLEPGVINAPALLAEIAAKLKEAGAAVHVINLSLLPFSPEDAAWLDRALGRGAATVLSRGYGNCRITATGVARVWWVQYFNSQDALILNTLEVTDLPDVARAAPEDLEDSAERLAEVLEWVG